ncbi:M48 family metallopeptidase [Massilia niabensis]|uniref:M48 family metallopeptidase n=1 Tax=Massilia niabensis TaxID=544910 RepID=A0ABW0L7R6_9BURK
MLSAHYFDGRSARLHLAQLCIADGVIALQGDVDKTYRVTETRLAEPFSQAPAVLYFADGARCEIAGPRPDRLLEEALGYRRSCVVRWQHRIRGALAALLLLVALLVWSVGWGIPLLGARIADATPPSVDQAFGERALAGLEKSGIFRPSRLDWRQVAALAELLPEVAPADMRLRLLVRDSPYTGPNVFALPDGTIVVTDLMARLVFGQATALNDYQRVALKGVLAHEIAHIQLRHTVREVASSSLTAALSSALLGDFSGASAIPATLANLNFSREMETEADEFAIRLLREKGMSTLPMADLLDWFQKRQDEIEGEDDEGLPGWFSGSGANFFETHPLTAERTGRLHAAARQQERLTKIKAP